MNTMKKTLVWLACAVLLTGAAVCLTSCGKDDSKKTIAEIAQIPNPWHEYDSMADAVKDVDISVTLPDKVDGKTPSLWQGVKGQLLEVRFGDDSSVRKGVGSDDVSGDYNEYEDVYEVNVEGRTVTFKGNYGMVMLAVWQEDGYAYAISIENGVTEDEMIALVAAVK